MYVIINGVNSDTIRGLQILSLPPITKPKMRTSVATIDGRPGDIVTYLGYEAYNKTIKILLHDTYDLPAIMAYFNQSGTIIFSNDPDKVYTFETIDQINYERAVKFKTASVTIHAQPYKLSATEEPASGEVSTLVDRTPYIIRRTPFGTRQKGTIVGGSIVWNQLFVSQARTTANGVAISKVDDNTIRIYGTATGSVWQQMNSTTRSIVGHKYFADKGSDSNLYAFTNDNKGIAVGVNSRYTIGNPTTNQYMYINVGNGTTIDIEVKPMLIDITLMFGASIADYIYSLEQATAGAGVAFFRSLFSKPFYAYNAGEIVSVNTSAHRMTGKNVIDIQSYTEKPSIVTIDPDGTIHIDGTISTAQFVRAPFGYTLAENDTFTLSANNASISPGVELSARGADGTNAGGWISLSATNRTRTFTLSAPGVFFQIQINAGTYNDVTLRPQLEAGSTATSYEPYTAHEYPLDSSLTLRGILKLDGDSIYYDGDIYPPSGEVTRRYWVVDMGTINYTMFSNFFFANFSGRAPNENVICSKFVNVGAKSDSGMANVENWSMAPMQSANGQIKFKCTEYTTTAEFKAAMSGVYLLYEVAEPTTEQAEPYTALQICDPAGTEEWVGASMPVGHETTYIDPISMTVTNEGNTESAPSITIEGEGMVEVTVDGLNILQIQMPASGEIAIDSKTLDATDGEGGLANRSVTGDYNGLRLAPGEHTVTVTGDVTSVTIKNASRWI